MKQVRGFWLPKTERHLVSFVAGGPLYAGGPTYQLHKLLPAMDHVKSFRHAIDVGAHCGLWTRPLSTLFGYVTAFEPVPKHRECLNKNIGEFKLNNVTVHPVALGRESGAIKMRRGTESTGDSYVWPDGGTSAEMRTLDSFNLQGVDFIKADCEGFEYFVMLGGEATIKRDRPCILVEQKTNKGLQYGLGDTAAVDLLVSWGATLRFEIAGDYCLTF